MNLSISICRSSSSDILKCCCFLFLFFLRPNYFPIYLFDCAGSPLQQVGSLVVACGIQFPDQGLNRGPLHWEYEVLAPGPPEKSLKFCYFWHKCLILLCFLNKLATLSLFLVLIALFVKSILSDINIAILALFWLHAVSFIHTYFNLFVSLYLMCVSYQEYFTIFAFELG